MSPRPGKAYSRQSAGLAAAILVAIVLFISSAASAADECGIEYKQFRDQAFSCDAAVLYSVNPAGLDVAVSAVVYGSSTASGRWRITGVSLNIGSESIQPDAEGKIYARKEKIWEYPAGVVFAAMDTQVEALGLAGSAGDAENFRDPGLGLLSDEGSSDISGENRLFAVGWDTVDKIDESRDFIEFALEGPDKQDVRTVKVALMKAPVKEARYDCGKLRQDELMQIVETLRDQIVKIEKNRDRYKEGVDPEFTELQGKIEDLEVERALAYKTWYERREK